MVKWVTAMKLNQLPARLGSRRSRNCPTDQRRQDKSVPRTAHIAPRLPNAFPGVHKTKAEGSGETGQGAEKLFLPGGWALTVAFPHRHSLAVTGTP
jgi:hypothetical protein